MRVVCNIFFFLLIILFPLSNVPASSAEVRSFNEIFPNLPPATRTAAFSSNGFSRTYERAAPSALIGSGQSTLGYNITNPILSSQPGFLVESILVVPGRENQYPLLKVYNALGQVRGLQGRLYHSHSRNAEVPLFEDVTRIESARSNVSVADPPPAARIPPSETIFLRMRDVNFGNSFYRADMVLESRGLRYTMTNSRDLTYGLVPVIRAGNFTAQLYFEPITEGMLIYGLAGANVGAIVSSMVSINSAIDKRLAVIIGWVSDGIKR